MSGEFTDPNWTKWLETATRQELLDAEAERALQAENMGDGRVRVATLAARQQILSEIERRDRVAEESRQEFFPRIAFRDLEDAEFMGEVTRNYASTLVEKMAQFDMLKRAAKMATSLGMPVSVHVYSVKANATQLPSMEELEAECRAQLSRTADLLQAIGSQLQKLRAAAGGATKEDEEYDAEFSVIAKEIRAQIMRAKAEEN